jgi:3-hydroxyisobutyrate dehydrogenase-like beta-hydroxyacid dehydrogenase
MTETKETVAVIGIGIMGSAIARNLADDGFTVRGFDVDQKCLEAVPEIVGCSSLAEAVAGASIALTSLPSIAALEATVTGLAAAAAGRGLVVAELSTLPIAAKEAARRRLADAGITLLDCPLSGTGAQAVDRDLAIYASGSESAFESCRSVFAGFTRVSHYLGTFGNGSRMKFVANLLVAVHNVATAEALVLGAKAGLDPRRIVDVISSGAANSRIFELRGPMMAYGNYEPATMKLDIWQKDMSIIGAFAHELGVDTPTFTATAPLYQEALSRGMGAQDVAAVCALLQARSGLPGKA